MRYLSKKIFLFLIVLLVFILPNVLQASCNKSTDPNVFKIHGTKEKLHVIEEECFEELLKAMGEGKNISLKYTEIRGDIDFTNTNFFQIRSFADAERDLNEDDVSYFKLMTEEFREEPPIVIINGKILIKASIIDGGIKTESDDTFSLCFFKKAVSFRKTKFNSAASFIGVTFGESASFNSATFDSEASFIGARFNSGVDFSHAQFGEEADFENAKFDSDVDFIYATFHSAVNFTDATFDSDVDFRVVTFDSDVDFDSATFESSARFEGTKFGGDPNFIDTKFGGEALFASAMFNSGVLFEDTKFNSTASFSRATFESGPDFIETTSFHSDVDFSGATFDSDVDFTYLTFPSDVDFSGATFHSNVDFTVATFDSDVDFGNTKFSGNCSFERTLFGINSVYLEKNLNRSNIIKIIAGDVDADIDEIDNLKWQFDYSFGIESSILFTAKQDLRKKLSEQTVKFIRCYRAAINQEMPFFDKLSAEKLLPVEEVERPFARIIISFESTTFSKFADFRNTFFLGDTTFREATFKEVGLFDKASFFNLENLHLIEINDKNSLVNLDIDKSYFNLLKGLTYKQIFPNLHKRIKYADEKEGTQTIKKQSIETYKYLQENFRKIGNFEDADQIYYERKQLEARVKKNDLGLRIWNWCLDKTCKYGTSPGRIVLVSIIIIGFFWFLYSIAYISIIEKGLGTIEYEQTKRRKKKLENKDDKQKYTENNKTIPKHTWYHHLWHSFYLSLNTFTTVGTGDIIATRVLRVFVLIEGALGWFILGLFIVVISSKYFR